MDQTIVFKINSNELFNFSLRLVSVSIYVILKKNVNQYSLAVCCVEIHKVWCLFHWVRIKLTKDLVNLFFSKMTSHQKIKIGNIDTLH